MRASLSTFVPRSNDLALSQFTDSSTVFFRTDPSRFYANATPSLPQTQPVVSFSLVPRIHILLSQSPADLLLFLCMSVTSRHSMRCWGCWCCWHPAKISENVKPFMRSQEKLCHSPQRLPFTITKHGGNICSLVSLPSIHPSIPVTL